MDFKILELEFKNEIIESINNNVTSFDNREQLLQVTSIEQLLEIEQNTNNDSLDPLPKNFGLIKINVRDIHNGNPFNLVNPLVHILKPLISDDYVYEPILTEREYRSISSVDNVLRVLTITSFSYRNKNIHMDIVQRVYPHYNLEIIHDNKKYNNVKRHEVWDIFVPRLPCFVYGYLEAFLLEELQKSYNVIPIEQFKDLHYLKPRGLLTKSALKK